MQKKLSLILINFALLFGAVAAVKSKEIKTAAYVPTMGSLPSKLNLTDLSDAEVNAYYDGTRGTTDVNGLRGDALLAALYDNIKDHEEYTYNTLGQVYKITDRDWDLSAFTTAQYDNYIFTNDANEGDDNPYLIKLYADYNGDINTADRYKNEDAPKVSFDKEHIWAQSLGGFGRNKGAGSDLHALWPSDRYGNQQAHSNYNFSEPTIDRKAYKNDKGTISGYNGKIAGSDHKVFEPLDEFKGDVARAMFYMPARYYEYVDNERPKLSLVNGSPDPVVASPGNPGLAGDLALLLQWHEEDPVSEFEIHRNNLLYNNFQKNRNPFIDHPEWARIAYDPTYPGLAATTAETSSVGANSDPFSSIAISHLELNTANMKTTYFKDDAFSLAGLAVRAYYSDGSSKVIRSFDSDFQTGDILVDAGEQTVTISYTHTMYEEGVGTEQLVDATFQINVKSITLRGALMISEVYGGGGNGTGTSSSPFAPFKSDFVELYNDSDEPINLTGKSVQYSAPTSNNYQVARLEGIIQPKSYFLVEFYSSAVGDILPLSESLSKTNIGTANLKVALVNNVAKFDETIESNLDDIPHLIDFLGGGTADKALGTKKTGAANDKSYQRKFDNGNVVNDRDNSLDFEVLTPTPMNSALSVAEKILVGDVENQCLTRYEPAKELVLKLSDDVYEETENGIEWVADGQLTYFKTGGYGIMPAGRARYEAWAIAMGDEHPYELIAEYELGLPTKFILTNEVNYFSIIIIITFSVGLYFVLRKKETIN